MIIYKITNLENKKVYIGQTIQLLRKRIAHHKCGDLYIDHAIQKYGWDNFKVEIVEECETIEELNAREIFWIAYYNCIAPNGYNLTTGGKSEFNFSTETRKKISKSLKGRIVTSERRAKISATLKKYFSNPEARAKMSEIKKNISDETKRKISEAVKKRFSNPEERKKLSEAKKGSHHTKETRAKMSATRTGKHHSEETRIKQSLNRKDKKRVRCIETGEIFESLSAAARKYNSSYKNISKVCKGLRKTAGGKHWEFVDES